jgi:hypothetical protein
MNAHGKTFSLRIRSIEPAPMWMLSPNEVNERVRSHRQILLENRQYGRGVLSLCNQEPV